jgi:hypothetical protein
MPQTVTYSMLARRPLMARPRELIWIQEPQFVGWGCSKCSWVFKPSGPPVGNSLSEMKENYLRLRDEASATHVCAGRPRTARQSTHRIPQRAAWTRPIARFSRH